MAPRLRILVVGSSGFIGSAICARLAADGHQMTGISRSRPGPGILVHNHIRLDVAKATRARDWRPVVQGIDAVINCAGILQDSPGESVQGVHAHGVRALIEACETEGIRRIVHFSAIGVDRETPTAFSRTKHEGDALLIARDLDWVILRRQ